MNKDIENKKRKKFICIIIALFMVTFFCLSCYFITDFLQSPIIELNGDTEMIINVGEQFNDPGASATLKKLDLTDQIKIKGFVDNKKTGVYLLEYLVSNTHGTNTKKVVRQVTVVDTVKPSIILSKGTATVNYKSKYKDPGYKAVDNYDGDITDKVEVIGAVNTAKLGIYELSYIVSDSSNNQVIVKRKVRVVDQSSPQIVLKGSKRIVLSVNSKYVEPGFVASDNYDGDITNKVWVSKKINISKMGIYEVVYSVRDSSGNYASVKRIVQVGTQTEIDEDNYVLVSIIEQKIWYYKNGKLVLSSNIVTGQKGSYDTPKGRYRLISKARNIYLTGPNYRSYVNYWMLIDRRSQIGLHDATWRPSFGGTIYKNNGSHGCINLPYSIAQRIYNSIEIGTAVIVY